MYETGRVEKVNAADPAANPWIVGRAAAGGPRVRLLCFPQAGGSAGAFATWRQRLPDGLELLPVELPGHGTRRAEPMPATLEELAGAVLSGVTPELGAPYALFGHSFGALVAYELARQIRGSQLPQPQGLLLSAARPPHVPPPDTPHSRMHLQDDETLVNWLRETNGLPEALLRHPDYVRLVLTTMRADATLTSRYRRTEPEPLGCPLHVFGGLADPVVTPGDLEEWVGYEGPDFSLTLYPGDHFYLYEAPDALLNDIATTMRAGSATEGNNAL